MTPSGLLLDTHVWLWSQASPEALGEKTQELITNAKTTLHVSTISTLEVARLAVVGRVELRLPLEAWVSQACAALRLESIELSHAIAGQAYALPGLFHRDPADRIIVATARTHQLTVVTADERILAYPHVRTWDARK